MQRERTIKSWYFVKADGEETCEDETTRDGCVERMDVCRWSTDQNKCFNIAEEYRQKFEDIALEREIYLKERNTEFIGDDSLLKPFAQESNSSEREEKKESNCLIL